MMQTDTRSTGAIEPREWVSGALWAIARLWVGWQFLEAGLAKVGAPAWTGAAAGGAIKQFLTLAMSAKMSGGAHPNVLGPYVWLSQTVFLPHAAALSYLVTASELLVGLTLLFGVYTRIAALGGACLNFVYMLGGATGLNPLMFTVEISIVLTGVTAGLIGLDLFLDRRWRHRLAETRPGSGRPALGRTSGRHPQAG